jgi:hypothetical protein
MPKILLLLCSLIFTLQATEPTSTTQKGKLLYEENFEEMTKRLEVGKGEWTIVDGTSIKGLQLKDDKHTAFRKMFLDHQDVIYQFDIKLTGKSYGRFIINYDLVHLANCNIKQNEISITKNNETKKRQMMAAKAKTLGKPVDTGTWEKKNVLLDKKAVSLKLNQWHTVTISMIGDTLSLQIGDTIIKGSHPGLKERKTNFGIQVAGLEDYVHFDNLKIWQVK